MLSKGYKSIGAKIALVMVLIAGAYGVFPAGASKPNPAGNRFLNPDGTLKLDGSVSGSLDLAGWDVQVDPERGPIFSPKKSDSFLPSQTPKTGDWFALGNNPFSRNNDGALWGGVHAIAISGTDVYVGGEFYTASGNLRADYIAKWDGVTWSNLGDNGVTPSWRSTSAVRSPVYAIAVSGNNVYIGTGVPSVYINGTLAHQADYIAKWDGTSWSGVGGDGAGGSSLNGGVQTLTASGNNLYVGGSFTNVKNGSTTLQAADYIAKWDGTNWSALGDNGAGEGSLNSYVYAISVNGSAVYAGGYFTDVRNGTTTLTDADYIAKWDGMNWSALGNNGSLPVNGSLSTGPVYDIAVSGNNVYVGGAFTNVNNFGSILDAADYIAKWDGANWSALGNNGSGGGALTSEVMALEIVGTDVYAGGSFQNVSNNGTPLTAADYLAKWDGTSWSSVGGNGGTPPNGSLNTDTGFVGTLASNGNDLYVGGMFRNVNNNGTILTNGDNVAAYHMSDPVHSIYRVAPNGSTSPSCGNNWSDPCDFQYALNTLAIYEDEIWVKAGTYKPGTNRLASFNLKNGVAIYGGFAGTETSLDQRDPIANITILSGDLNGNDNDIITQSEPTRAENVYHVVWVWSESVSRKTILDGFTITGGNANVYTVSSGGGIDSHGGGLINQSGKPILRNLIFTRNSSVVYGGGMANDLNGDAFLENVRFDNNFSDSGGGLGNSKSSPILVNVTFEGNTASYGGGGVANSISCYPSFYYVSFINNSAVVGGGGMYNWSSDPAVILGSTFYGNQAEKGAGIFNLASNPSIYNTTFTKNSAVYGGSAVWNENGSGGGMASVTIAGNDGGIMNVSSSTSAILSSIIWGNYFGDTPVTINNDASSSTYVSGSVVQNGYPGGTNIITTDPLLGPVGYYGGSTLTVPLRPGSPAIDHGSNCLGLDQRGVARPQGTTCDIGAYEDDGTIIPTLVTHSVPLLQGWNLVSFKVHPTDTNITSVLASIAGNYDLVYAWDATGAHAASGNWLKADNIPASPDSLTVLNETMGFWVHMTSADTLEIMGTIPQTTSVSLVDNASGWNLVAYPSNVNGSLPIALADHGVGTDFSLVYAFHPENSVDAWKLFDTNAPPYVNDLTQLVPGFGYWVKMKADHTWVVEYGAP